MTYSTATRTFKNHKRSLNVTHDTNQKMWTNCRLHLQFRSFSCVIHYRSLHGSRMSPLPTPTPQKKERGPCLKMIELFLPCSSNSHLLISLNSRCFCFLQVEWPPTLILLPAFCFIVLLLIVWTHKGFWLYSLITSSYKEKISHKLVTKQNQGSAV